MTKPPQDTSAPARLPSLRFHYPVALHDRVLAVLDALDAAPDPTAHRAALAAVVIDLTRAGMNAYYMQPLAEAKAGLLVERSASVGMAGAVKLLGSVIGTVVGHMGPSQLRSVSASVRQFMR